MLLELACVSPLIIRQLSIIKEAHRQYKTHTTPTQHPHNTQKKNTNPLILNTMAKYINNRIKSGKVAGSVYAVRYGEVIERAYNPYVSNPKSEAQVNARARFKLLSQLAAVMAPVVAIAREGAVSARNLFTMVNFPLTNIANGEADITLTGVQLTKSQVSLPSISSTRGQQSVSAGFAAGEPLLSNLALDRVVYCMFVKTSDSKLRLLSSVVVNAAGGDNRWTTTDLPLTSAEYVILAYGMRFNSETARSMYGNMQTVTAETVAKLISSRTVTAQDITMTETRGVQVPSVE